MPRRRQAVAQQMAERLFAVESAIDAALTQAAELTAALPKARAEARLSAIVGQAALDRTAASLAALIEARRCIVEAHEELDAVRDQIGLCEVDVGELGKPPEATGQARHLRSVGSPPPREGKTMPRQRQAVAQQVADRLFAVEQAIDEALAQSAELTAALPKARAEARLSATVGHAALDRAAAALAALVEARRCIVEAHEQLDIVRARTGLREVNVGDAGPKPTGDAGHLRSVA